MATDQARAAGRSANRRGQDWQRRGAAWLRETGIFPGAEHVGVLPGGARRDQGGSIGDLRGAGDRVVEMTVQPWDRLGGKLRQAEDDARGEGLESQYFVWKPIAREQGGPARSVLITRAEVLWPLLARLDRLERAEIEGAEAYDRGYRNGFAAAQAAARDGVST